jgi:hypothetical protein
MPSSEIGGSGTGRAARAQSNVEATILDYIRAHPNCRFQNIVSAVRSAHGASRATVARHLSKLLRFGEVTDVRGSYTCVDHSIQPIWTHAESRRTTYTVFIHADGSSWEEQVEEFRVRFGQVRSIHGMSDAPNAHLQLWASPPHRVSRITSSTPSRRLPEVFIDFDPPLTARDAQWETISLASDHRHRYRMYRTAPASTRAVPSAIPPGRELEDASLLAPAITHHAPHEAGASLLFRVVLPPAYPFRSPRFLVQLEESALEIDPTEQARIQRLSRERRGSYGFRLFGSTLSLIVPDPLFDRRYVISWGLPTHAEYTRWHRKTGVR